MWVHLLLIGTALSAPLADLVKNRPGLPADSPPNFDTYSGYLNIPNSNGKSLHYILVESQNNPATDPLLLWLNGGPGCSSLDGFIYEHGPYVFPDEGTTLFKNQWSWNTNASVIYLEAPAGVGWSVMGDLSNNSTDDEITAHDSLQAILQFFRKFPEYRYHDFYISGESYAGIYVPTLAYNVLMYNNYSPHNSINLKGIAVGNGITDWNVDSTPAFMKLAWTHALIGYEWYEKLVADCDNLNDWSSEACNNDVYYIEATLLNNINIYDVYGPCIYHNSTQAQLDNNRYLKFVLDQNPNLGIIPPCCAWQGAYEYLQSQAVRTAFNIPNSVQQWTFCVNLDYQDDYLHGSVYIYPYLIRAGLRILVYSGDVDGSVPFIGTREWINSLNLDVKQSYASWYVDEQVAGYYIEYEGLTWVTVKGAGHMVPQWKRPQAWHMINSFLSGVSP
ncbi:unnamed protein product [Blepharisma stoltei]|uniref:Carboxypeptidase n=1 Tax=Blepharisma stoltei TaxID=1481888 RepID=A0AAU9JAA6_9CILI|nr:unnamed protein product [Blepharisma stoltei]